jgi:hypothetical protein
VDNQTFRNNHYVPRWYQDFFLFPRNQKFHYLDLKPEQFSSEDGIIRERRALLSWGTKRCFRTRDLYTTVFRNRVSTEIEEKFFGRVDSEKSLRAVRFFTHYQHPNWDHKSFNTFINYLSIQRLRTPFGLQLMSNLIPAGDQNSVLIALQKFQNLYCALWTECVWQIANAHASSTKFIVSDNPVTFYNKGCFPKVKPWYSDQALSVKRVGTHTIFPLSMNTVLILTNLGWVRNPFCNPTTLREHPNMFRPAMFDFQRIQTNRTLSENEVLRINHVIKTCAYRYIAAAEEEWLFPEAKLKNLGWHDLGQSDLFMPDPRSVEFSREIIVGYGNGVSEVYDEYGRSPLHPQFKDDPLADKEWDTFHAHQALFAKRYGPKRRGRAFSHQRLDPEEDSEEMHKIHLKKWNRVPTAFKRER